MALTDLGAPDAARMSTRPGAGDAAYDIVIATLGRPSLDVLLASLAAQADVLAGRVVLADDRPQGRRTAPLDDRIPAALAARTAVVVSGGRGPAAARNAGWAACSAPWIVFLDDDVVPDGNWARRLARDLAGAPPDVAAVQGRIEVPLPADRRPTDRERNVARLASARWITADLAVRHDVLRHVGGFDERFRRAYREDTDLQLRIEAAGHRFAGGDRGARHPVGPAPWWASAAAQRGNADDALLRALHGPGALGRGRRRRHQLVTVAGVAAAAAAACGRRRLALAGALGWAAGTVELAWARIAPGPRTSREVLAMAATSVAIPPLACAHWAAGRWRSRHEERLAAGRPSAVVAG